MFLPWKQLSTIIIMDFEYDINDILKNNYTVYTVIAFTLIYVFFRLQAEPLTKFVDSIYGKAILLFLLLWLLTEEHYTISICIIISIISTLYWIREKRDYELVKYTINTEPSKEITSVNEKPSNTPKQNGSTCPENSPEFHNL